MKKIKDYTLRVRPWNRPSYMPKAGDKFVSRDEIRQKILKLVKNGPQPISTVIEKIKNCPPNLVRKTMENMVDNGALEINVDMHLQKPKSKLTFREQKQKLNQDLSNIFTYFSSLEWLIELGDDLGGFFEVSIVLSFANIQIINKIVDTTKNSDFLEIYPEHNGGFRIVTMFYVK